MKALVTGGGSGIGKAIALALAASGYAVTICGRRRATVDHPGIAAIEADVTDEAAMNALHAGGPFDVVVANAGAAASAPAHRTTLGDWERTIAVNLTGAFLSVRPAIEPMRARGRGRIIFIASTAGLRGYAYVAPYVAAKHGVIGLMRALATELAETGVTVNAICPGFTETELLANSVARIVEKTGRGEAEARASLVASNPQGRFIQPEEIAGAVLWLASDAAGSVTGQAISISGGETW